MAKLETQIQIRKMLKPSTPTPNHLQRLNLSLFDQLAPPIYISMMFYYLPSSERDRAESVEKCAKLQKSLADTLAKFYPLAGRFIKDDLSIHCNDEGVEYVETKVDADLAEFLHEGLKIELLDDLLPWCVPPKADLPSSPLLGIQVNVFNCGGLVIGIQISHILADSFTLATFLNEWAHTSLTGSTKDNCIPNFGHLSSLFPTRVLSGPDQGSPPFSTGAKIVTRNFVFDALAITKLKDKLIHSSTAAATLQKLPSRVVVVVSVIWKVLLDISSAKRGHDSRDCVLFLTVNFRGKSNAPSSEHAVGNFWMTEFAILEAEQSRKELNDFVDAVGTAIRDTSVRIGNTSIEDIPSLFVKNKTKLGDKRRQRDMIDIHGCTSWCRFPWYEADFGWGKPFWVSSVSQPFEVICLIDTKDGDGIEAWISLKENDMAEFERHPDILTFCSPLQN